ncbi:MAG TPA: zinc-dependent metalloprotease [Pirellulaceae bacterium]|nr:zinc-dependent metalloprotease [Pirellulaceae bacterium]
MKLRVSLAALLSLAVTAGSLLGQASSPMSSGSPMSGGSGGSSPPAPPYASLLKDAKTASGMWTVHQKGNNLYWEIGSGDYGAEYIVLIAISRGIAQGQLLGGMTWSTGDDWVWQFRKVGENVHIIRKNVRFKANANSPEARAVASAYTDSVLFSLPIMMKGPKGGDLVDMTSVFMSDLPQIGQALPGFSFSSQKSTWAEDVKAFDENMELEVAATYASSGQAEIDTVPDSRGVTINVHYSISKVPNTGYSPRLADDRVGYFLTAVKDFSSKSDRDQFVRYINRWDLQKADSSVDPSPPKKAIIFHIEKTVPFKYRKAISDGIDEWNKAFEKAGFVNAIEVTQQGDRDDKDPEDIRYNFFRWITSNAGFAMGPSRVNPYTGQILDADIIFDADFLTSWKQEYETLTARQIAQMTGGDLDLVGLAERPRTIFSDRPRSMDCQLSQGMSMQLAFGQAAILAETDPKIAEANLEKLIQQGLKEVTMHEVGHTLGLRHNFKGSKWRSLSAMNDGGAGGCLVASVMDYSPTNIVPKGAKQGDYYSTTLGPYDFWAIEYGYKPLSGSTQGDAAELKKIAARSGDPALAYATDEDTRGTDPDPDTNRFDLGNDPLEYAGHRLQLVKELMPGLVDRMTKEGEDFTQARRAFNVLIAQYGQSTFFVSRYVGGLSTSRSHKGDKDARPPISLVEAGKQREALKLLEENMFSDKNFQFPPELLNSLGWSNWMHWGVQNTNRKDFGVHDFVLQWQERTLAQLLSSVTLKRMHDAELKAPTDADVMTTAELLSRLTKSIYSEVESTKEGDYSNRKPAISSMRRNLQRSYLKELSDLALGVSNAPQDCQTVAYSELANLQQRIKSLLDNQPVASKLDTYSRAHLQETGARIAKVLDARLNLPTPSPRIQIGPRS